MSDTPSVHAIVRSMRELDEVLKTSGVRSSALHAAAMKSSAALSGAMHSAAMLTSREIVQRVHELTLARQSAAGAIFSHATPLAAAIKSVSKLLTDMPGVHDVAAMVAAKEWRSVCEAHRIAHIGLLSVVAEKSLLRVPEWAIGSRLGLNQTARDAVIASHAALAAEYGKVYGDATSDNVVAGLPERLAEMSAVEFVNHAALVVSTSDAAIDQDAADAQREVTDEIAADTSEHLTALVGALHPDLPAMLHGARAVLQSGHPDHVRHFAVSLRELFTHVLHRLAPDEQVKEWTTDTRHYHNGRPTRKARLLYITRHIGTMFGGFLKADVDAAVDFVQPFQEGTHVIRPTFTDDELCDMLRRMEGLLRFMLVIREMHGGTH